jgi:tripartite-type tricarboxylate transporter receptor subunit TctC
VTGPTRTPATPDIPAVAETYPGFEVSVWLGFQATASTPRAIIDKLNANILKVTAIQDVRERLINLGADPVSSTPEQFYQHIAREKQK